MFSRLLKYATHTAIPIRAAFLICGYLVPTLLKLIIQLATRKFRRQLAQETAYLLFIAVVDSGAFF